MAKSKSKPGATGGNCLLLSCMDLRLLDETVEFMDGLGLTNKYDHVILAGAALGALVPEYPHWGQTFWDHVQVAREFHDIDQVLILEHRDCGAYRKFLNVSPKDGAEVERKKHAEISHCLSTLISLRYPSLSVRCYLIDTDPEKPIIEL